MRPRGQHRQFRGFIMYYASLGPVAVYLPEKVVIESGSSPREINYELSSQ